MILNGAITGVARRPNSTARNKILPLAAAVVALTLQAPTSASVNTQEWLNVAGSAVASMDKDGKATVVNLTLGSLAGVLKASAGVVSGSATTSDLPEGTNLYYTDTRARAAITGTASRITVTLGVVDISAAYVGQASLTTLGTIGTGVWQGTAIADTYISSAATWNAKEPAIAAGTTAQYWRGDKSWQTLNSTAVGLGNVENTALSTWAGTANITTLGTIGTGTWNATAIADGKIASALTGKTYNALTLTAAAVGFTIAGGTTSKTLTVSLDATVTGTNSGDQTITLTSDVTGSGTGSFATTIAAGAVSLAKMANLAANSIIGNNTGGAATPIALTAAQVRTLLGLATVATTGAYSDLSGTPTIPTGANPSGTAGLSAVNGSASTFMRSDGAPAISQSITPTWSGAHVFQSSISMTGTSGTLTVGNTAQTISGINISSLLTGLTGTDQRGLSANPAFSSAATASGRVALLQLKTAASAFTMTDGMGINVLSPSVGSGSTITNAYGIKIEDQTAGGTLNYAFYTGLGTVRLGDNLKIDTVGKGIYIKEGTNATMGVATLVLGVATVSTTKVTANSRIFICPEALGTIASPVALAVTARSAGTSFTITSANLTDTSTVAWVIMEPA